MTNAVGATRSKPATIIFAGRTQATSRAIVRPARDRPPARYRDTPRLETPHPALRATFSHNGRRKGRHSAGSTASEYSFLKRAISSAAGMILPTVPTPWPLPQISFQAFGLARSPDASVPKLIFEASDVGRLSGSIPAATIEGFRELPGTPVNSLD